MHSCLKVRTDKVKDIGSQLRGKNSQKGLLIYDLEDQAVSRLEIC